MRVSVLSWVLLSAAALAAACGGSSRTSSDSNDDDSSQGGSSGANAGGTSGTSGAPIDCGFGACYFNESCYVDGVSPQPKGDGCNTCSCVDGTAVCTNEPCDTNGDSCVSEGKEYPSGSLVPVDCNSCLCIDGELRDCTHVECDPSPHRCWIDNDCPQGTVCIAPTCSAEGVCVEPQPNCPTSGDPVCDCFGITRGSHCEAQKAYRAVAHEGACQTRTTCKYGDVDTTEGVWQAGDDCNYCTCADGEVICTEQVCPACGDGLPPCAADEYCRFPSFDCGANGPGQCDLKPRSNCQFEAGPSCGCDGQTYGNFCFAHQAGQSLAAPDVCGLVL